MSYQLPQELRTPKLNNAPDDVRSIAEKLIAKKMGISEVVEGDVTEGGSDFLDRRSVGIENAYPLNTIRGELVSRSGQRFNFIMQVSPSLNWGNQSGSYPRSSVASEVLRYIEEGVKRYVRQFEEQYRDYVADITLEMNGNRKRVTSYGDLEDLVSRSYRNNITHKYHSSYWTTTMTGNWNYS